MRPERIVRLLQKKLIQVCEKQNKTLKISLNESRIVLLGFIGQNWYFVLRDVRAGIPAPSVFECVRTVSMYKCIAIVQCGSLRKPDRSRSAGNFVQW